MSTAKRRQVAGDHFLGRGVQPWDVVDTWPREQRIGYYRGGALKYLMRMGAKDESAQEIAKGQHYLEKLLEVLREEDDGEGAGGIGGIRLHGFNGNGPGTVTGGSGGSGSAA